MDRFKKIKEKERKLVSYVDRPYQQRSGVTILGVTSLGLTSIYYSFFPGPLAKFARLIAKRFQLPLQRCLDLGEHAGDQSFVVQLYRDP